MANHNTQKQSRKNTSLRDWFEWTNPCIPFKVEDDTKCRDSEKKYYFSLLESTGLGLLIHSALATAANPFHDFTRKNKKRWPPLARILTAPLFAALALPLELWKTLDLLVACVATPLLWVGQRLMNAALDVFKPHYGKSNDSNSNDTQSPGPYNPSGDPQTMGFFTSLNETNPSSVVASQNITPDADRDRHNPTSPTSPTA